jgi:hypothetical protein
MKKAIAFVILPMLILSPAFFSSCGSCQNRTGGNELKKVEIEQKEIIKDQIEKKVYPLPTSAQVIKMLSDFSVGYTIGITNPVANNKKYFSSSKRAVNLGVYGADLSYASLYNRDQEVINILAAIQYLASELNMSKIYNKDLYDQIKKNFDNRDTLVKILEGAFNNTYAFLTDNDQQPLALLVVGGAWVEGIYLTTQVSDASYQYAGISKVLLEQKESLKLFLEITKPYSNDPSVSDFLKAIDPVKIVYDSLGTSLTAKNIKDITDAIVGVRTQVIL